MNENLNVFKNPKQELNKLLLPILIAALIGTVNGLIDTSFSGLLGANALSAVGLLTPSYMLLSSFGSGIGVGSNALMSRAIGKDNLKEANKIFNNTIFSVLAIGIILTILLIVFKKQILFLFGATGPIYPYADGYSVMYYGTIIMLMQGIFSSIFRVELKGKIITYCNILTIVINFILNYVFMIIFGWGAFGIGLSTLLSSLVVVLLMIATLYFNNEWILDYSLKIRTIDLSIIKKILTIGIPSFIKSNVYTILNIVLNYLLLFVGGSEAVGIYSASWRLIQFGLVFMSAYGASLITICSMFFGKDDFKTIKELYLYALRNTFILGIILVIIFNLFGSKLALIIGSNNPALCMQIGDSLKILSLYLIVLPISNYAGSVFISIDKPNTSLMISVIETLILEIFFMVLLVLLGLGVKGIYIGQIIGIFVAGCISLILLYKNFREYIDIQERIKTDRYEIEKLKEKRVQRHSRIKSKRTLRHMKIRTRKDLLRENLNNYLERRRVSWR